MKLQKLFELQIDLNLNIQKVKIQELIKTIHLRDDKDALKLKGLNVS